MDLATKEQSSSSAISELQKHLRTGVRRGPPSFPPPVSTDPAEFIDHALALRGLVTAINVTDGAGSKAHIVQPRGGALLVEAASSPFCRSPVATGTALRCRPSSSAPPPSAYAIFSRCAATTRRSGTSRTRSPFSTWTRRPCSRRRRQMRSEHAASLGHRDQGRREVRARRGGSFRSILRPAGVPTACSPRWKPAPNSSRRSSAWTPTRAALRRAIARTGRGAKLPILIGSQSPDSFGALGALDEREALRSDDPDALVERLRAQPPTRKAEGRRILRRLLQQLAETPVWPART